MAVSHYGCWELNLDPLQESLVVLNPGPHVWLLLQYFDMVDSGCGLADAQQWRPLEVVIHPSQKPEIDPNDFPSAVQQSAIKSAQCSQMSVQPPSPGLFHGDALTSYFPGSLPALLPLHPVTLHSCPSVLCAPIPTPRLPPTQ